MRGRENRSRSKEERRGEREMRREAGMESGEGGRRRRGWQAE